VVYTPNKGKLTMQALTKSFTRDKRFRAKTRVFEKECAFFKKEAHRRLRRVGKKLMHEIKTGNLDAVAETPHPTTGRDVC
jgi:hypothetical protein